MHFLGECRDNVVRDRDLSEKQPSHASSDIVLSEQEARPPVVSHQGWEGAALQPLVEALKRLSELKSVCSSHTNSSKLFPSASTVSSPLSAPDSDFDKIFNNVFMFVYFGPSILAPLH